MLKSFLLGAATALVAVACALYAVLRIVTRVFEAERKRILSECAANQARSERERVAAQPPLPALPQRTAAMQREVKFLSVCALPASRVPCACCSVAADWASVVLCLSFPFFVETA